MALTRYLRSIFFGPDGPTGDKFSKQNKPTKQRFKELFESIGFIKETDDRAKTTEQGFTHLATDNEAHTYTPVPNPTTQTQSKVVEPHQLPQVGANISGAGDTIVSSDVNATRRITVKKYKRTINFGRFRTFFKIENIMGFRSANANLTITDPDPLDASKVLFTCNCNPVTPGPVGPAGDDAVMGTASKNAIVLRANAAGIVPASEFLTGYIDLKVMEGDTIQNLTTFTAITISPATNPASIGYVSSYPTAGTFRIRINAMPAGVDSGVLTVTFDVDGDPLHIVTQHVSVLKIKEGLGLVFLGTAAVHPVAATHNQWYTNTVNNTSYWFDDADGDGIGTWRVLSPGGASEGPSLTHTIPAAGYTYNLTAVSAPIHIIRGTTTLTGAVNFTHSGAFPDGWKFTFIFLSEIDTDGNEFNVLGTKMYPSEIKNGPSETFNSNAILTAMYDGTAADFMVTINNRPMNKEWADLEGFGHYALGVAKPKVRYEGNRFYLNGLVIVPLSDGGAGVVEYTNEKAYAQTLEIAPFVHAAAGDEGIILNGVDQSLTFNEADPVFPDEALLPDKIYYQDAVMLRRVLSNTADYYITYTSYVRVEINLSGQLTIRTVRETEYPTSIGGVQDLSGNCMLRFITSHAERGDLVYDFRNTSHGTLHGTHGLVSGDDTGLDPDVDPTIAHAVSLDAAAATDVGGFFFMLNISGFIAK